MNLLSWIVIGIGCGWLIGALLIDDDPWVLLDLVFATVGAVLGGWWVLPDERAFRLVLDAFDQSAAAAAVGGALALALPLRWLGRFIDARPADRAAAGEDPRTRTPNE